MVLGLAEAPSLEPAKKSKQSKTIIYYVYGQKSHIKIILTKIFLYKFFSRPLYNRIRGTIELLFQMKPS